MDKVNILDTLDLESRATAALIYDWPEPQPIPNGLLPVEPFELELLPESIRPWIRDIAERMQCPLDFVGVGVMVALAAVIGRKAGIKPKRKDNWLVIPNLWGMVVGRPASMKSPAVSEVLRPLNRLVAEAKQQFDDQMEQHEIKLQIAECAKKNIHEKVKKLIKSGDIASASALLADQNQTDQAPILRRYIVNDSSVEALGEILIENPFGVLAYRDELSGLLRSMDKDGQENARSFYLQGFDGNQSYTSDRIMRGRYLHIPSVCISMLGGIQPSKIRDYIHHAVAGGSGDDGLLQRFGLMVYPDINGEWKNIDRYPDTQAKNTAFEVFERLNSLPGGTSATGGKEPVVYEFTDDAQILFDDWRCELQIRLRKGELHPAIESHLAKYTKTITAIALICALSDDESSVSKESVCRALAWSEYLESHSMRIYSAGLRPTTTGAKVLLSKIKSKAISDGFKPADIYLKGWSYLSQKETAEALSLLVDLNYLASVENPTTIKGGRPSLTYRINPKYLNENA
jgi:putative DNA primase/helicase